MQCGGGRTPLQKKKLKKKKKWQLLHVEGFIWTSICVNFNFLFFSAIGICILPDAHSIDQSHIPFSPDNVNLKTVHECQEPSSSVHSTSPSVEENKIVLDMDKQNTKEEIGLTEEVKENTISSRFILLY